MGEVKKLLDSLLLSIYGDSSVSVQKISNTKQNLQRLRLQDLYTIESSLRRYINKLGMILAEELIELDHYKRSQELLCRYMDAALQFFADNTHPPMRFSLIPPPAKRPHIVTSPTNKNNNNSNSNTNSNSHEARRSSSTAKRNQSKTIKTNLNNNMQAKSLSSEQSGVVSAVSNDKTVSTSSDVQDDYNQWLHAMKLVARLPGGMPPEFRRKLWLTLAEKYLKSRNVDWDKEERKCFSEEWREDDEELGVQIVKDLHRTGSNLCSGPAAKVNQARLKRVLLGYARYNPEVGYCQGFNMLGALILQVMDKEEVESMKVMIYLVEGILPPGYFCGSMGGLQADMGVFRELMQTKLPRLAKHLEKLQGPVENAFEPPLTNVFTMQWFLTMFCTCLPMTCVLRVWDLVLIEGSDVLLRTALVLWSLLEERVLGTRSADDFYCKMGSFASELLNGHLIDSNSLIEKVVQLGPITDIDKMRNKHLYNITPLRHKSNIPLYLDDEEPENDEESRMAVATVWGIPWTRRGSQPTNVAKQNPTSENKDRLALDISLLKKQYDKLRERQKQAHIIITTACSTARQGTTTNVSPSVLPVNQLLMGRTAIVTNQGRRVTPPAGVIPPARKPSLPTILQTKPAEKQLRRGETLHWRDTDLSKRRRDSLTWKEIKADQANQPQKVHSRVGKSDSSSYSEESDNDNGSSTDTSLCDDDPTSTGDKTQSSSIENSPKRRLKSGRRNKGSGNKFVKLNQLCADSQKEHVRPKSWAPSTNEIPFMLLTSDSPTRSAVNASCNEGITEKYDISNAYDRTTFKKANSTDWAVPSYSYSPIAGDLAIITLDPLNIQTDIIELPIITSTSQLSPMPDVTTFLKDSSISPLPTPKPSLIDSTNSLGSCDGNEGKKFDVSDDGVTNQYFERVNSVERPTKLNFYYPLDGEDSLHRSYEIEDEESGEVTQHIKMTGIESTSFIAENQRPDLLIDHPHKSTNSEIGSNNGNSYESMMNRYPFIGERDNNIPGENLDDFQDPNPAETPDSKLKSPNASAKTSFLSRASQKRRDPRRLTLTRSTTIEMEERFQALEKHLHSETSNPNLHEHDVEPHQPSTHEISNELDFSDLDKRSYIDSSDRNLIYTPRTNEIALSTRSSIPSTTDLEERYERQMSASDKTEKEHVNLRDSSTPEDDTGTEKRRKDNQKDEIKHGKNKDSKLDADTQQDIKSLEADEPQHEHSSPKRMPSTAELEERFNALERKMSVDKISPSKTKKEPPDIKTETKRAKSEGLENSVATEETLSETESISKDLKSSPERLKNTAKNENEDPSSKKKGPPSTAELEKRFHALEKQMSTSTSTNDSNEKIDAGQQKTTSDSQKSARISENENRKSSEELSNDVEKQEKQQVKKNNVDVDREILIESKIEDNESSMGKTSGRRASEPPSTEDLERRYESLKRRMSTKIFDEKSAETIESKGETHQKIGKTTIREDNDDDEYREKTNVKAQKNLIRSLDQVTNLKDQPTIKTDKEKKEILVVEKRANENDTNIPRAPPLPQKSAIEKCLPNVPVTKERQALIEELQTKIEQHLNEESLKPSSINPNRKPSPSKPLEQPSLKRDETSEPHALTAFLQSENYEPWHGYAPKAVRRFSDLSSKGDLENRLEFLEQKFYNKLFKQRCASDSEVASRKRIIDKRPKDDEPSSSGMSANTSLEKRLQALEKQLSENSLKLLEAMRAKAQAIPTDNESLRKLSSNTIDATGKELVRYTHVGELEESGVLKPINISINIQMTLDKNVEQCQVERGTVSTSDLERRLEALEVQLKASQTSKTDIGEKEREKEIENSAETAQSILEKPADSQEINALNQKNRHSIEKIDISSEDNTEDQKLNAKNPKKVEQETLDNKESTVAKDDLQKEKSTNPQKADLEEQIKLEQKKELVTTQPPGSADNPQKGKNAEINNTQKFEVEDKKSEQENIKKKKCSKCEPTHKEEPKTNDKTESRHETTETKKPKTDEQVKGKALESKLDQPQSLEKSPAVSKKPDPKTIKKQDQEVELPKKDEKNEKELEKIEKPKTVGVDEKLQKENRQTKEMVAEAPTDNQAVQSPDSKSLAEKLVINASDMGPADANKKTLVLLLDNEPKAVKVRRLTRANTEELEGLFQALEKQLQDRNLVKSEDGTLKHLDVDKSKTKPSTDEAKAISELTKEIEQFTSADNDESKKINENEDKPYDWGPDPIKRHLKRKTVHLPSTKELEARFRSLERQIKLLEDVENIDVEQRLREIERKIKLQYSLAHETDLTKYLELCEGKGLDAEPLGTPTVKAEETCCECGRKTPTKESQKTSKNSPGCQMTSRQISHSPPHKNITPGNSSPKSPKKDNSKGLNERLVGKSKHVDFKKQPIHPLEMLLDPSPQENKIPTTGELEHRIRMLDEKRQSPTQTTRSRSRSPIADRISVRTPSEERYSRRRFPVYEDTPTKPSPPTAEELEARMKALEEDHVFDPKTQRNFKEFNEKLKNVISPSRSFEECKSIISREVSPRRGVSPYRSPTSKPTLRSSDTHTHQPHGTSPKVLRFSENDDYATPVRALRDPVDQRRPVGTTFGVLNTIEENSKILHRILKKTIAESRDGSAYEAAKASLASEGLDAMGSRLMRETSPLTRTGTHTGVPLRTDDNINDRLSSIKDTIKSIDSLCEEKPYRKEKCQRYIDSLFSDSVHFASKKTSLEDLRSRSASRTRYGDYTPTISVSDFSQRPSDRYLSRSIGSAESIRTTSPLRAASPLHYRSNRDLTRNTEVSPNRRGRRYDEDREEYESRVRRDYISPNLSFENHRFLSSSGSSLTKIYKVDSQLEPYERDKSRSHTPSRSPVRSQYEVKDTMTLHNKNIYTTPITRTINYDFDKPASPYRQTTHTTLGSDYGKRLSTPVYNPSKLEIRHTTVTSTFYDRLLTEKQMEKSYTPCPLSHSPVHVSPTFTEEKRNLDTSHTKAANTISNDHFRITSNYCSSLSPTLTAPTTLHQNNTNTITTTTTTTTGNFDSYSLSQNLLSLSSRNAAIHNDLRIRSCDNIIMQLNSTSVTTASLIGPTSLLTSTSTTATTLSTTRPININSTLSNLNNTYQITSGATIASVFPLSESAPLSSTYASSRFNSNQINSLSLSTTSAVSTSNFSSYLPSITDRTLSAFTPIASTATLTTPFISNSYVSVLAPNASTVTRNATNPIMSATPKSLTFGSESYGFSSTSQPKNLESYFSTMEK